MHKIITITSLVLAACAGGTPATSTAAPTGARAVVRHFEGTVTSVDRTHRTFRVRTVSSAIRFFRVVRATKFQRIGGFVGLHRGLRVDLDARRSNGS